MTRLLAVAMVLFLISTAVLSSVQWSQQSARFDWPDEGANAFFAKRIATGLPIAAFDQDIARFEQRLHPRSVNVIGSALVPGGFLGLPLFYGTVASWFGFGATLFLTPLLTCAAAAALYIGLRRRTNVRVAFFSALLFLFHPAVWYFSAYGYLPNIPFFALFLISAMILVQTQGRRGTVADGLVFLSGAAAGAALAIRLSEAVWVLPVLVAALWPHRHERRRVLWWLAGFVILLAPVLIIQVKVFGSLLGGYGRYGTAEAALPSETISGPLAFLFPFGVHPLHAALRLWDSWIRPFWWYVPFAGVGVLLAGIAALNDPSRARRHFSVAMMAIGLGASAYLVLAYGSWRFADPVILAVNTIGRSYVRYWLPLAALSAIAAAAALARVEGFPELRVRVVGRAVVVLMIFASYLSVFVFPNEALLAVRGRLIEYGKAQRSIAEFAGPVKDVIVLTHRLDKIFFPKYRIIALGGPLNEDRQVIDLILRFPEQRFVVADVMTFEESMQLQEALGQYNIVVSDVQARNTLGMRLLFLSTLP